MKDSPCTTTFVSFHSIRPLLFLNMRFGCYYPWVNNAETVPVYIIIIFQILIVQATTILCLKAPLPRIADREAGEFFAS